MRKHHQNHADSVEAMEKNVNARKMNDRKLTILKCELNLFQRDHRTKEDLRKMWGKDPEAVEWFKEKFGTKKEEEPDEEPEKVIPEVPDVEIPPPEDESNDYNRESGGY